MEAESVLGRRAARALGVLAICAIGVVVLFLLLSGYINPTKPDERKDLVLALAQILGGAALLSGLYFTWRTLQVNREGQITERFTRAIEQLGATYDDKSKNLELRLGGIYALERIARESEKDHWSIMEVLTAYVRQHAPWRPEEAKQIEEDAAVEKKFEEDSRGKSEPSEVPGLAADIQAIMTVIGRRPRSLGYEEPERLDLHDTNLSRANLSGANFSRAIFREANLSVAYLSRANLSGAILWRANLWKANLSEANLSGSATNLSGANLSGAIFRAANLSGTNLSRAILTQADLWEANLSGAHLWAANLSGANLSGAILTQAQLKNTTGDENTQLPADLEHPAHWNVKTDEQIEGE